MNERLETYYFPKIKIETEIVPTLITSLILDLSISKRKLYLMLLEMLTLEHVWLENDFCVLNYAKK